MEVPAIYLNDYIIQNKSKYYTKLQGVTKNNNWEDYIFYMLDMIEHTALKGLDRLSLITHAMEEMTAKIKEKLPKIYSKDLIEILFRLPYTKRQNLIEENLGRV
ncbi:Fic family protein [Sphingobacterium rhinopitheci]|uniref:hypothetical protein n=1 Tax=Sphingobacterium rhinopitheci TaxID=2781960 RepID=UPI001F5262AF|nr:hypothetical protein [Sphingobacterium rhinopitheci]